MNKELSKNFDIARMHLEDIQALLNAVGHKQRSTNMPLNLEELGADSAFPISLMSDYTKFALNAANDYQYIRGITCVVPSPIPGRIRIADDGKPILDIHNVFYKWVKEDMESSGGNLKQASELLFARCRPSEDYWSKAGGHDNKKWLSDIGLSHLIPNDSRSQYPDSTARVVRRILSGLCYDFFNSIPDKAPENRLSESSALLAKLGLA